MVGDVDKENSWNRNPVVPMGYHPLSFGDGSDSRRLSLSVVVPPEVLTVVALDLIFITRYGGGARVVYHGVPLKGVLPPQGKIHICFCLRRNVNTCGFETSLYPKKYDPQHDPSRENALLLQCVAKRSPLKPARHS